MAAAIDKKKYQITEFCRRQMAEYIREGGLCLDATMGNGNDTLWLCQKVGEKGQVLAFDIQEAALENTKALLKKELAFENYQLFLESHENMDAHVKADSVDVITFNLGYLPSGDHTIATKGENTCRAISRALPLLKVGGLMEICIYSGGDSGFEERDMVLEMMKSLDSKKYLVLTTQYLNRPNNPPMPVAIVRLK